MSSGEGYHMMLRSTLLQYLMMYGSNRQMYHLQSSRTSRISLFLYASVLYLILPFVLPSRNHRLFTTLSLAQTA